MAASVREVVDSVRDVIMRRTLWRRTLWHRTFWRRLGVAFAIIAVTLVGTTLSLRAAGQITQTVGPFTTTFQLDPSLHGGTNIAIPPLGSLRLDSHSGPATLSVRLDSIDEQRAREFLHNPQAVEQASDGAVPDVATGVARVVMQSAAVAILGTMLLAAVVFRRMRRVAICGSLALAAVVGSGSIAAATFRPAAIEEPTFQGLLVNAPAVIGDAHTIASQFGAYQAELQGLVTNVTRIYETITTLPVYQPNPKTIRVLHISDLHLNPNAWSVISTVVSQFGINIIVDTGDINDWGSTVESSFVAPIAKLAVPYVFIRGNHDSAVTARAMAKEPNAIVLENSVTTVDGLTIAGIGDPRFTPDKTTVETPADPDADHSGDVVYQSGEMLARTVMDHTGRVDIAMVHDPASAAALTGVVPVILAGHLHRREMHEYASVGGGQPTLMLVEGSTGGAGLRGLQGETPTPLEMSVLYFDATSHQLQAYDAITLGGTGQSQVTLERHIVRIDVPSASPSGP